MPFLSLSISESPTYIIFLLPKELLLTFFVRQGHRQLATNSLYLCFPKKVFTSSLLKDKFSGYKILGWWLSFSLNSLKFYHSLLLTCMVSEEKSDIMLIFVSSIIRVFPPMASFWVFSLSLTFSSLKMICPGTVFSFDLHLSCLVFSELLYLWFAVW